MDLNIGFHSKVSGKRVAAADELNMHELGEYFPSAAFRRMMIIIIKRLIQRAQQRLRLVDLSGVFLFG